MNRADGFSPVDAFVYWCCHPVFRLLLSKQKRYWKVWLWFCGSLVWGGCVKVFFSIKFWLLFFPKQYTVRGSQFFLKMCLSVSLALFVSLHLSPFMCPSGWWCPALRVSRFICLALFVSLHVSFWVVVSGSPGLSLYLSPFMCPSGWWCPALRVSRFICLPSCVLLGGGVRLSGSLALFVSLHVSFWVVVSGSPCLSLYLSPFMCPSGWWCPALRVSRFICLPSCVLLWWCPALRVSRFICLPSCVLLGGGVRLSGSLALFVSLPVSFWVVVSGSPGLSLYLSPFMCPSGWWCPALRVSRFICLPSCVLLGGGVRLSVSLALFVSLHVSFWVVVSASLGLPLYLSPFICLPSCVSLMCLPEWWCPPLRSCLCLVSLHLSPFMCLPEWWCSPLRSCLCRVYLHLSPFMCLPEWWCPPLRSCLCLVSLHLSPFMCLPEWCCSPLRSCLCRVYLHLSP